MTELVGAVLTRPSIDLRQAAELLRRHWGIDGALRVLPSERDRNVAVAVDGVDRFVLKVSNAAEDQAVLAFQHAALHRLRSAGVPCQLPVPAIDGEEIVSVDLGRGRPELLARVLTWLPGRPLATVPPAERSDELLRDLGRVMAASAAALAGWDDPAAHRPFQWESERSLAVIAAHADAVSDPVRRGQLAGWRHRLAALATLLPGLRHGVIHNDANDYNVLVSADGRTISGLLDLGDAVWSVVVNELAVAAAYAALDTPDPSHVIATVRAGFEERMPLTNGERAVVSELVALRLATSVALSAHQSRLDPGDPYLTISEAPAWALLERLAAIEPATAAGGSSNP
jgi:Ser/Thr protein kinase RdoA (MazF antagonist)